MSGGRCEDNRKGGMVTRAHQPCLNSASSRSRRVCVGILGAVGREGRNSRLSHYHETSGLAQTREESVHTTQHIYEILHCHTETCVPHHEALAPNIQILNTPPQIHPSLALLLETFGDFATDPPLRTKPQATPRIPISDASEHRKSPPPSIRICEPGK